MEFQAIRAAGVAPFAFTVDRKAFTAALTLAKRVTERRNTIPILSNVLFRVRSADVLEIVATDLDVESCEEFPCDAPQPGAMTLTGETLLATIRKMKGASVRLEDMGAGKVALTDLQTGSTVRLPSLPAADFPNLAFGDMPARFEVDAYEFAETIATVRPAVSTEETRYYLNGIFIHTYCERPGERTEEHEALTVELAELRSIERGIFAEEAAERAQPGDGEEPAPEADDETLAKRAAIRERLALREAEIQERIDALETERTRPDALRFAATDGHRLFCYSRPLPEGGAAVPPVILPRKSCALVSHIVPKKGATEAHCAFSDSKFSIRVGRVTLRGKLIDGTFPDYTRVIPSANPGRLAIADAAAFRACVEGTAAVCTEKTRAITCSMTPAYVTLYASSPEFGTSARVIEGASYSVDMTAHDAVEELPLGANARYLLDALEPFGSEAVEIQAAGHNCPFRFCSDARPGLIIVLMPMRSRESVFTPADVNRLNMNPLQLLQASAAEYAATIAVLDARRREPGARQALKLARRALGEMVTAAKPMLSEGMTGHWQAKAALAAATGDVEGERLAGAVLARLQTGPAGSLAALAVARPAPSPAPLPPVRQPDVAPAQPGAEPARPAPIEAPRPAPQAVESVPEAAEPVPNMREGHVRVAKVADVHERVFYVVEADLEDESRSRVRRVHKDGAPFCRRESEGGGWQTIHRQNIARRILPRGTVDAPAKAAKPLPAPVADNALADRVAALEALVARMAGGDVVQPEPVEIVPAAVLADIAIRAGRYGIAQGEEEPLDVFLTRLQGFEAMERETVHSRERESTREIAGLRADVARLADERGGADEAVRLAREEAEAAKAELAEAVERARQAVQRAAVLQVRCDALESHAAASARLDTAAPREPVEA